MKLENERTIKGLRLVLTSVAHPEQYDVFEGNKEVGYIRLRDNIFRVDYPIHHMELNGKTIFELKIKGNGTFINRAERKKYLTKAVDLINERLIGTDEFLDKIDKVISGFKKDTGKEVNIGKEEVFDLIKHINKAFKRLAKQEAKE